MFHLADYTRHLRALGRAPATIRQHRGTIGRLSAHLQRGGVAKPREVCEHHVADYLKLLRASSMSPERYRQVVARLRDFFAFLEDEGLVFVSPLAERALPRYQRALGSPPAREGLSTLLDLVRTDRAIYLKGKAIMELAYSSALRPREIYGLALGDIDAAAGRLFIDQSKNCKDRIVPVGSTALAWLRRYIDEVRPRYLRGRGHDRAFIKHHSGAPENREGVASAVRRTLQASGLPLIRPSEFRASAATDLLRAGMHVVHISRLLGHSEIETTQRYLRVDEAALAQTLAAAHPRTQFDLGADR